MSLSKDKGCCFVIVCSGVFRMVTPYASVGRTVERLRSLIAALPERQVDAAESGLVTNHS